MELTLYSYPCGSGCAKLLSRSLYLTQFLQNTSPHLYESQSTTLTPYEVMGRKCGIRIASMFEPPHSSVGHKSKPTNSIIIQTVTNCTIQLCLNFSNSSWKSNLFELGDKTTQPVLAVGYHDVLRH